MTMNIHMAAAFDRSPVVTDLREIPWAKQGDIIAVRPVERREWEPQGAAEGVEEGTAVGDERRVGREPGGRGVKGFFLFRLGGNDEMKLKKLQQVSPCAVALMGGWLMEGNSRFRCRIASQTCLDSQIGCKSTSSRYAPPFLSIHTTR